MLAFLGKHSLKADMTVGDAEAIKDRLRRVDGLNLQVRGRELILLLNEPSSLKDAPPGDHDFARGWLILQSCIEVAKVFGEKVCWQPVEHDPSEPGVWGNKEGNRRFCIEPNGDVWQATS